MYITPKSKNPINSKFNKVKEKGKENGDKEKQEEKKSFSQKLFNQKKYIKIIPTKNEKVNNNDDIKKNKSKVMMRNKSNLEHTMKFLSDDNSFKKDEHLINKTKNFLNYPSAIYTQKHSKNQSFSNIHNKSKNETRNVNLKQNNLTYNESKLNVLFLKNKNVPINKKENKIFKFPISSKNKKLNSEINPDINCDLNNNDNNNSQMLKTFIHYKKPEICFKNLSSNSSINIFNHNKKLKNNIKLNSLNSSKKSDINISLISKMQKSIKNKNKPNFNFINFNNKNLGAYLKKLYYNNNYKFLNENNSESNRNDNNNNNNNNYILINHLLLNGINITGNNSGNIINKNIENAKPKEKLSRNDKCTLTKEEKEGIYFSNNDKNDNFNLDSYLNMKKRNINFESLDIKRKIIYKSKFEENTSPEEIHFNTVDYFQKVKISKYNVK